MGMQDVKSDDDKKVERKTRMVSVVIAGTMIVWIAAQYLGKTYGLAPRYAVLFDLLALVGFFWSLVVIYQIWRARRDS